MLLALSLNKSRELLHSGGFGFWGRGGIIYNYGDLVFLNIGFRIGDHESMTTWGGCCRIWFPSITGDYHASAGECSVANWQVQLDRGMSRFGSGRT